MAAQAKQLASQAKCVIVGGGVAGLSAAYHLAKRGWKDILLLERGKLTSGTTWHAAGNMGRMAGSKSVTEMRAYGMTLYGQLSKETGLESGLKNNGGLAIATNPERLAQLRRVTERSQACGVSCWEISPEECKERYPILHTSDVLAGFWSPDDGQINPVDSSMVLAKAARNEGVTILEDVPIEKILVDNGAVSGVQTSNGTVRAEYVLIAGGLWSRSLAEPHGVTIPLWPCEHEYVISEPIPGVKDLPLLRSYDESIYVKEDAGKLLVGLFEPNAKPAWKDGVIPTDDMEHLEPYLMQAMDRIPALQEVGFPTLFCGPESFTPDGREMIGEVPNVQRLYACCGFNSHGIACGPSAGDYIAEWMDLDGNSLRRDWGGLDIRRFQPFQGEFQHVLQSAPESLAKQYHLSFPNEQRKSGRNVKLTPYHFDLADEGACFGAAGGYERPMWFAAQGEKPEYNLTFGMQNWQTAASREMLATRNSCGLFDLSSFSKFFVQGADAVDLLQHACANNVVQGEGRCVYTPMLNEAAGVESDFTVTQLASDLFMVVSGSAMRTRDLHWLKKVARGGVGGRTFDNVMLNDVTDHFSCLGVFGPNSRQLFEQLTDESFSNEDFPFATAKSVVLYGRSVVMQRLSFAGELGWEVYVDQEQAHDVFTMIRAAGREQGVGLELCGTHSLVGLRMEKGFLSWGHDVTTGESPLDVGLGTFVDMKKEAFVGRDAYQHILDNNLRTVQLLHCTVDGTSGSEGAGTVPLLTAGDPVLVGDRAVGMVTSACHSATYDTGLVFVHVDPDVAADASLEVSAGGERKA